MINLLDNLIVQTVLDDLTISNMLDELFVRLARRF